MTNLVRSTSLLLLLLAALPSAFAGERWPGLQRVQRSGQPSIYAVQSVADMERSGVVSQFSLNASDLEREPDQMLDLSAQDELNQALATIVERARLRLEASPAVLALLRKASWTRADRVAWERELAVTASEERHRVPGLGSYRSIFNREFRAKRRPPRINDLSLDIRNGTEEMEFDCEQMTAVDGIVLGRLERAMLPPATQGHKRAVSYVRATGYIYMEHDSFNGVKDALVSGHHVFLLSPASGNFVEATANPLAGEAVYRAPMSAWGGIGGYLRGESALVHAEGKFIHYGSRPDDVDARAAVGLAKQPSYVERAPELIAAARKEAGGLAAILRGYNEGAEARRLAAILSAAAGRGLSAPEAEEIRGILKSSPVRELQGAAAEKVRVLRFRLGNLRYLESRLRVEPALGEVRAALAELVEGAKAVLAEAVFDVETAAVEQGDPSRVLKEKLSGKHRIRMPLNAYPGGASKLPLLRPVSAGEDINLDLG